MLLQWHELHYSVLSLSNEMMHMLNHLSTAYFLHDRNVKLVGRWGKFISIFWGYDAKR